ncbi:hypothetical protein [Saccharopolyspora tripterygii]
MSDQTPEPDVEQLTIWRNVLDALGQLNAAWENAVDSSAQDDGGAGALPSFPDELVVSLANAGVKGARALTGIAGALDERSEHDFSEVVESQKGVEGRWESSRDRVGEPNAS